MLTIIMLAGVLFLPAAAQTLEANTADRQSDITLPSLGEHKFIPSNMLRMPFISTNIRSTLGFGQTADLVIPIPDIGGREIPGIEGDLFYAVLEFHYMQKVKSWLGFWVRLNTLGRLSTETSTLISEGINTSISFELGWMFKLWKNESMMLSGSVGLWNNAYTDINLINFIQKIIDNGGLTPDNKLIDNVPVVRGLGGLHYAWAISDMTGINVMMEIGYGEAFVRSKEDDWSSNLGIAIDLDLNPRLEVPIGFSLAYWQSAGLLNSLKNTTIPRSFSIILAYTGEQKFSLQLQSGYAWYKPDGYENNIKFINSNLTMRYYF